jgi:membrane protein required for beta-lactamase induction
VLITTGLITIFTSGIIGIVISIFFFSGKLLGMITFLILFLGMTLGPIFIFWISKFKFSGKGIFEKINKFLEGWRLLHKSHDIILFLAMMDVCTILLMAMRYLILFNMFSLLVSFASCILISPFNIITHFATFIPGAYGVKEAAVGAASALTGIPFTSGVLATLSDRVIMMALTFIMGPIFSFILLKHSFKGKPEEKTT